MDKAFSSQLQIARVANLDLLALTEQEKWPEFIEGMTEYVSLISNIVTLGVADLAADERIQVRQIMEKLLENEAVMRSRMRSRLSVLHKDVAVINKGRTVSHAYSQSFTHLLL